ncbi:purine hydroxylase gamma subunit apoprotein [Thermosyntropha lipolytica DSM 11003]|uniref:Purine hydroxylase gamma subunit apoprotein n=1 Tax=Thermosyntropha lipolytica DSM 11003 TaxID=1123382 RepID=A0A1M5LDH8_9FIRM|nr:FAD binding domain-containing protein [Thermosyntropha lipolytica]SHG63036.1 purine hydroxylase gamma subunit apoprotein [Thermosyntropha lipolytica DSM 11003]
MELKEVIKARTLEEVLDVLDEKGEKAKVIAGGTDLVIQLREGKVNPEVLVDISDVAELCFIKETGDFIEIGAATRFVNIKESPVIGKPFKGLQEAAGHVGSPQIRNLGTVGGNICNASPAADTVPALLALDAVAVIKSKQGTREMPLEDIYIDRGKVKLEPQEILYAVKFLKPQPGQGLGFVKLGLRKALAISTISLAVFVERGENEVIKNIRIGSGALSRFPVREREVEDFVKGKKMDNTVIEEAAEVFGQVLEKRLATRPPVEKDFKPYAIKGVFKEALNKAWQRTK